MVDPQWNMFYWGFRCSFYIVSWGAVGCKWGQPLFTLGLHMFALSLEYFLSLPCNPSSYIDFFGQKYHFEVLKKIPQHISCRFDTRIEFVGQILVKLEMSFIRGFLQLLLWCPLGSNLSKHADGHSLTTKGCRSVRYGGLIAHWSYLRYDMTYLHMICIYIYIYIYAADLRHRVVYCRYRYDTVRSL